MKIAKISLLRRQWILAIFMFCAPSRSCLGAVRPGLINRNPGDTSGNDVYAILDQSDEFRRPKKLVVGLQSSQNLTFLELLDTPDSVTGAC